MQPFYAVYTYYKGVPAKQTHGDVWAKNFRSALNLVKKKVPKGATLLEAWIVECKKKDFTVEQLFGHKKEPHKELMDKILHLRNGLEGKTPKKDTVVKPRVRLKPAVEAVVIPEEKQPRIPHAKKPFELYGYWTAISMRDLKKSQQAQQKTGD